MELFQASIRTPWYRGSYEGLFQQPADENMAPPGCAGGRHCLPGGTNCSAGCGARSRARGCAIRPERDLASGLPFLSAACFS